MDFRKLKVVYRLKDGSEKIHNFQYKGGGENESIVSLFEKEKKRKDVKKIPLFNFDNIYSIKIKLQEIFNIEAFKICLYWKKDSDTESSYNIYINEELYYVNYEKIEQDPILLENKEDIWVQCLDEFISIPADINTIYVINIDDWIDINKLRGMRSDIEEIYYSFVIKYFPIFTIDVFYNYIQLETEFKNKYPNLFIEYNSDVDNQMLKLMEYSFKVNKLKQPPRYYKKIQSIIYDRPNNVIDLRNLFNILHIGENNIAFIVMKLYHEIYKKKPIHSDLIYKEYKADVKQNSILIYLKNIFTNITPQFLRIYENAKIEIVLTLDVNIKMVENDIISYISKLINPIISIINKYKNVLLMNFTIPLVDDKILNTESNKFNISTYYTNELLYYEQNYITLYQKIKDVLIFNNVNMIENDVIQFNIYKYITSFNTNLLHSYYPQIKNEYTKYTSIKEMDIWNNVYAGIGIKLTKSGNNIEISYSLVNKNDMFFIIDLIYSIINSFQFKRIREELQVSEIKEAQTIKRLKVVDPIMFSFKQSKYSKRKFSKICQKPFHPSIYTKEEFRLLPKLVQKRVTPFVNATLQTTVYYDCPSKKAPYLGFVIGEHPQNYCIPCCRVKDTSYKDTHKTCLKKYKFEKDKKIEPKNYILKNIEYKRYIELPNIINHLFNFVIRSKYNTKSFYFYGVSDIPEITHFCIKKSINELDELNNIQTNFIIIKWNGTLEHKYMFQYDSYIILLQLEDDKLYPIVNLDRNIFQTDIDPFINYFKDIIYDVDKKQKKDPFYFENISSLIKIENILVNEKNFIYGIIGYWKNKKIYMPTFYYFNNTKYKIIPKVLRRVIKGVSDSNIISFLKHHSLDKIIKNYLVDVRDKYFAFRLKNKLIIYFEEQKDVELDIEEKQYFYSYYDIEEALEKGTVEYKIENIEYDIISLYIKNIYKVLLQNINHKLRQNKDTKIRNSIIDTLCKNIKRQIDRTQKITNIRQELEIMNIQSQDILHILKIFNIIQPYEKSTNIKIFIIKEMNEHNFLFDEEKQLQFFKQNNTYKAIENTLNSIAVWKKEITASAEDLTNIVLPCAVDPTKLFCQKNKLILPLEKKNTIIKLLYNDFKDEVKQKVIMNTNIIIDDPYSFDIRDNEEIVISAE